MHLTKFVLLTCCAAMGWALDLQPALVVGPTGQIPSGFLACTEYVVLDALPSQLDGDAPRPYADVLASLPAAKPIAGVDQTTLVCLRTAAGRWAVLQPSTVYLRASAVSVIDARLGSTAGFPPMPAVPGGAGVIPLPQAQGVTLGAGTARIFCGVRTVMTQGLTADDVRAVASKVAVPTPIDLLKALGTSNP